MSNALGDYLDSINTTKKNIIRGSNAYDAAEKQYPPFPVARSLSYHEDCILLVAELNNRGTSSHGVSNKMHYEFLLHVLDKRKRFSRWERPAKDEAIELIMDSFNYSKEKAESVRSLFSDADIDALRKLHSPGGKQK